MSAVTATDFDLNAIAREVIDTTEATELALHQAAFVAQAAPTALHGDTTSSGRSMAPEGSREDHGSGGRARVEGTATGARPDTRNATGPEIAPPSRVA